MANFRIQRARRAEDLPQLTLRSIDTLFDDIRRRAFELFEMRGGLAGRDWDDWFQAERELVWSPQSEMIDKGKEFQVRLAVPGLDANDIQVTVTPDSLTIQAEASEKHEKEEGEIRFSEFSKRRLFRRLDLPAPIDVDKVSARLDKGVLEISAPKAEAAKAKKISVAAA